MATAARPRDGPAVAGPPAQWLGPFPELRKPSVAIYRLLRNAPLAESSHLFAAYELTLHALGLVDRNDPLTAMIADKIIEIGATGLRDPAEISKRTVKFLTFN